MASVFGDELRRFIVYIRGRKAWQDLPWSSGNTLSLVTVNTYVRAIKSFWSWLKNEGCIAENPLAGVAAPRFPKRLPRVYTEQELTKILSYVLIHPRERAIVEMLLDSGIRLSELTSLKVNDIDVAAGRIKGIGKLSSSILVSILKLNLLMAYASIV